MDARRLLLNIYSSQNKKNEAIDLANDTMKIDPNDAAALQYAVSPQKRIELALKLARSNPTPENFLDLSLVYYNAGNFQECIRAAQQALKLRPNYAEAYNNIGAAYNELKMWDKGIEACQKALKLKPDFELARNNLNWAKRNKH